MSSKYNNYLSNEEKEQILKMYHEGFNTVEIANQLHRNNSSIGRFLKKQNLPVLYSKCKLRTDDKKQIIDLYSKGCTAKEILNIFADKVKSENTIMALVKSVGIERPRGTVSDADCDYFETIDTEAKAYYLGLFLTDGNVHKVKRNTEQYLIQICLQEKDSNIIKKFKKELHSSNKIRYYEKNGRNECFFSISSTKMAHDLIKQGVYPNKTFSAKLNFNIPDYLFRHYIRGIFDGDGTVFVSKDRLRFGFYGTHQLVSEVQWWLGQQIKISQNKVFDKPTVSFVVYQKRKNVLDFYNLMYKDANFFIERKKEKFENYFKLHNVNTEVTN